MCSDFELCSRSTVKVISDYKTIFVQNIHILPLYLSCSYITNKAFWVKGLLGLLSKFQGQMWRSYQVSLKSSFRYFPFGSILFRLNPESMNVGKWWWAWIKMMYILFTVKDISRTYYNVIQRKWNKKSIFGVLPVMTASYADSNMFNIYIYIRIHSSIFTQCLVVQVSVEFEFSLRQGHLSLDRI